MERTNRAVTNRKSKVNARNARGMYVDGNTVRRLQEVPARRSAASRKPSQGNNRIETRTVSAGKPKVNPQRQRTRERAAMSMGRVFVAFLAVMSVAGEGKTTMLRLILSLLRAQSGEFQICAGSDHNQKLNMSPSTRKLFSYVPQGNTMFSGTIAENMRNVKPDTTDEEIIEALKLSCA